MFTCAWLMLSYRGGIARGLVGVEISMLGSTEGIMDCWAAKGRIGILITLGAGLVGGEQVCVPASFAQKTFSRYANLRKRNVIEFIVQKYNIS